MKFDPRIGLVGILTLVAIVAVDARALHDFYNDGDSRAWHEYGLEKFRGPWALVGMRSNGDSFNYTDYGSPIPAKFRPISESGEDDDLLEFLSERQPPRNETTADENRSRENHKDLDQSVNESSGKTILELVGIIGVVERTENEKTATEDDDRSEKSGEKRLILKTTS